MFLPGCYRRMFKQWIKSAKADVKKAQTLKEECGALYHLWRERDHIGTFLNRLLCWYTLNDKVRAGAVLSYLDSWDSSSERITFAKKRVEEQFGFQVTDGAMKLVQAVVAEREQARKLKEEKQAAAALQGLPEMVAELRHQIGRKTDYEALCNLSDTVRNLTERVRALEGKKRSKKGKK